MRMYMKSIIAMIVAISLCSGLTIPYGYSRDNICSCFSGFGEFLYVGGTGPNNFTFIQDAIDNANPGDTIFVYTGIYYENLMVNKSVNIVGENKNSTVIDGGAENDTIHICIGSDGTTIMGFTIRNCGIEPMDAIIEMHSHHNMLSDMIIEGGGAGLLLYASNNNTIKHNVFSNNSYYGIDFFSGDNNTISQNVIRECHYGVVFEVTGMSIYNTIYKNTISRNTVGIVQFQSQNYITENNFINNTFHAASIYNFARGTPSQNTWDSNYWDNWVGMGPKIILGFPLPNVDHHPALNPIEITQSSLNQLATNTPGKDVERWAIIVTVGINPHQMIYSRRDAEYLYNVLVSHGWSSSHIRMLVEEMATKDAIYAAFSWLRKNVESDDIVFISFGTHGYYLEDREPFDEPDGKDEFIQPFDYDWETDDNCILDDELAIELDNLPTNNIAISIEACHSGGMVDGTSDLRGNGRVILMSCSAQETSWPLPLRAHWLFPFYVANGLNGWADSNRDRWISAEEMFNYTETMVSFRMTLSNLINPNNSRQQHPQLFDGWPSEDDNTEQLKILNLN